MPFRGKYEDSFPKTNPVGWSKISFHPSLSSLVLREYASWNKEPGAKEATEDEKVFIALFGSEGKWEQEERMSKNFPVTSYLVSPNRNLSSG